MDTSLQESQQIRQAETSVGAIQPQQLNPNQGSTIPSVYTQDLSPMARAQQAIKPPSVSEIHKGMWEGSFMVALMAGLATGNPAAALTSGLWGAIAIHDHGYTLRQRSQYIPKLRADGYSEAAILDWYKTGNNKNLEEESGRMQQQRQNDARNKLEEERMAQQDREFQQREAQQERMQSQRMGLEEARLTQAMHHEQVMEGIALQNAQSGRIAAIARQAQADAQANPNAGGSTPGATPAAFNPATIQYPPNVTTPEERAAYANAMGRVYQAQQQKQVIAQATAAKNLRTSESQQTAMFDKVMEAAQKVANTPNNKAGDEQLLMQFQVGESPNVSPRTTQIKPLMESLNTGRLDAFENLVNRHTGGGLTDSEREQARELTKNNATAQAESHMTHVQSVVQSGGFDLTNPSVMRDLVAAFHVSPDTITGLANGTETPASAAQKAVAAVTKQVRKFGDSQQQQSNTGGW